MILTGDYTEHKFYNDEVTLRYYPDPIHAYFEEVDGKLVQREGVTTLVHIIDKSAALVPWAAKMVYEKLMRTIPLDASQRLMPITIVEFEKLALEAKGAHKEKVEDAANVGTIAHGWLERYIKIKLGVIAEGFLPFPAEERAQSCITGALDWEEKHNVRWVHTERKVYSRQCGFAGTLDGVALTDSCTDLKCCPMPFKDHRSLIDWKSSNYLYIEFLLQTAAYQCAYTEETNEVIDDRWIIRLGKEDGKFDPWHVPGKDYGQDLVAFVNAMDLSRSYAAVETRMKAEKDRVKAYKKEQEKAEREEALKLACKNSGKYKGTRKPTCNGGNPCQACIAKYAETHPEVNNGSTS